MPMYILFVKPFALPTLLIFAPNRLLQLPLIATYVALSPSFLFRLHASLSLSRIQLQHRATFPPSVAPLRIAYLLYVRPIKLQSYTNACMHACSYPTAWYRCTLLQAFCNAFIDKLDLSFYSSSSRPVYSRALKPASKPFLAQYAVQLIYGIA